MSHRDHVQLLWPKPTITSEFRLEAMARDSELRDRFFSLKTHTIDRIE